MPDLQREMGVNVEEFSRTISAYSLGGLIGGFFFGTTFELLPGSNEAKFTTIVLIFGLSVALKSLVKKLWIFGIFMAIDGLSSAVMNISE